MTRSVADARVGRAVPALLLAGYLGVFIWGAIRPYDRATWWAENIPIVLVVTVLVVLYARGVRFSPLAYLMMAVLPYWHTVGGHYTFERVPFDWFDRAFGFQRNMFDRVGHFSVGFFAFGILEYLDSRRAMSRPLAALFAVFAIAFVAMSYELIEWGYAAYGGNAQAGANFLGSQGDVWDAQKDMLMDTLGAVVAVLFYFIRFPRGIQMRSTIRQSSYSLVALLLVAAPGVACSQGQETVRKAEGGGVHVAGWTGKADAGRGGATNSVDDAKFVAEGKGFHVTTGPAVTYWNPANKASGTYTVKATFTEPKYMDLNDHPHPYGIMIAGNDLGTDQQSYLYCAAYGNGNFIVRGFGPKPFQMNGGRGEANAAVHKAAGKNQPVTQEIAVSVKPDSVQCAINGTVVASYPKSELVTAGKLRSTDGVYGVRFAHNTDAIVTGLTVTHP